MASLITAGCGDDKAGTIAVDNQSPDARILRYHDGTYVQFFQAPANTKAYVVSKTGGATGKVDVLSATCETLVSDLEPTEFGVSTIEIHLDGTATVVSVEKLAADLIAAGRLSHDRC